jgi:hypothetical protein
VCDEIEGQHGVTILVIVGVGICAVNLIPAGNICLFVDDTLGNESNDPRYFRGGFEIGSTDRRMSFLLSLEVS